MKTIQVKGHGVAWLFWAFAASAVFYGLHPSEGRFAVCMVVGAVYAVGQVGGHPDRWRTRGGSLIPAVCLVALGGFAAGLATALVALHLHH